MGNEATARAVAREPVKPATGSDGVRQSMDSCTKCGICHAHCPVAAVTGAFPGPKYTGPQGQRFRLIEAVPETSAALCTGCGVCTSVCPNGVAVADLITLAKAERVTVGGGVSFGQKLLNRPEMLGRLLGIFPTLSNAVLRNGTLRTLGEWMFGIHRKAPLPAVDGGRFRRWFADRQQPDGPELAYFTGCAVSQFDAGVGIDTVRLLNALGYRVTLPTDLCCSLPMLSSGEWEPARERAARLVGELQPSAGAERTIVATSTSCSLTLRSKYASYLDMNDEAATAVAGSMADICEFLADRHHSDIAAVAKPVPLKVLYHGPCQLRGHRIGQPAVRLLQAIPGLELSLSRADCCGVGGTYGYDREKYGISNEIGRTLDEQVNEVRPDLIVCDSETCRWNIEARTSVKCVHPVQLLIASIDGEGSD